MLMDLQNNVDAAMVGTGPWLKMLFWLPHFVQYTPQRKERIYAAQRTLNMAMFGQEEDPVSQSKARAMAKGTESTLYAPHRLTSTPRPRMNAPVPRPAIKPPQRDRYDPHRQLRRPQTDHYEPQREESSRELTLTLSPLRIPKTPEAMRAVRNMLMKANDSLKRSCGPRLALGEEDARYMETFMRKSLERVRYPDYY
jgi:hypothetical protein